MRILDLGCGPDSSPQSWQSWQVRRERVVAADIQQGMLDRMLAAVRKNGFEGRVEAHFAEVTLSVPGKFDFILASGWCMKCPPGSACLKN